MSWLKKMWRAVKKAFSGDSVSPSPISADTMAQPATSGQQKRVAFIICHSQNSGGGASIELSAAEYKRLTGKATSRTKKKMNENEFYSKVTPRIAARVKELSGAKVCISNRDKKYSGALRIIKNYFGLARKEKIDLCVELHSNGSSNDSVNGGEILVMEKSILTRAACARIMKKWNEIMGIKLRHGNGVKPLERGDRGSYGLLRMAEIADEQILPELFYHSSPVDAVKIYSDVNRYVENVAQLITSEFLS